MNYRSQPDQLGPEPPFVLGALNGQRQPILDGGLLAEQHDGNMQDRRYTIRSLRLA